jgi:aspartyl-tRNA(Asn)/glutamyl-tRNA(Gln) amidotransferase subunit A
MVDSATLNLGLTQVSALIRDRVTSAQEITQLALNRVAQSDGKLHAFITVDAHGALDAARRADEEIEAGLWRGPLHGVPIAVKDNIPTAGLRTTYNSRAYQDAVPEHDAIAVTRLREAGAVVLGKTNLNEFGWSIPSEADLTPPPLNPWNTAYRAVGSSSGSGVAVSSGQVFAALGTDGGGSTRLPAGQMGLVGLKPTRGSVPGYGGLIDEVSVVGVLARNAADAAAVYSALAQQPAPPPQQPSGARMAIPRRVVDEMDIEDDIAAAFADDLKTLTELGIELVDVELPHFRHARDANFVLIKALAHTDHVDDLQGRADLIGESTRHYLMQGASISASDYLRARSMASLFAAEMDDELGDCIGLVTPVTTVVTAEAARRPGEHERGSNATFTAPFNLTGWPAIAIPSHIGTLGIPIGLQIVARPGGDWTLLDLAAAMGEATGLQDLVPTTER